MGKRICLITHTEATHSVEGKVGGWYDSELTQEGSDQAASLMDRITNLGFDISKSIIYSSDLKRASQTAAIISEPFENRPILDQRLREMSFGKHEGIDQTEHNKIMVAVPESGNRMDHQICEGAESRREVATRITSFVNEIMSDEQEAVVITHGFAATFFIAAFQKVDIEQMGYLNYKLYPGSIALLEEDDLFQNRSVTFLNG